MKEISTGMRANTVHNLIKVICLKLNLLHRHKDKVHQNSILRAAHHLTTISIFHISRQSD